jgi:hypothetical protein
MFARWYIFKPKIPNLGKFWSGWDWKMLVYIVRPFGIHYGHFFNCHSIILWKFDIFFTVWINISSSEVLPKYLMLFSLRDFHAYVMSSFLFFASRWPHNLFYDTRLLKLQTFQRKKDDKLNISLWPSLFSPEANPTIVSYNASDVKIYNATSNLGRYGNKLFSST